MPDGAAQLPADQPPYLNPGLYPDYLELQRRQLLANVLLGQQGAMGQTPANWDQMRVVPRRSLGMNVAPLVNALMAGKAIAGAQDVQKRYYSGLYGGAPSSDSAPASGPSPGQTSQPPLPGGGGQSFPAAPASPQGAGAGAVPNPMLLTGSPGTSQAMLSLMGPQKYGEAIAKHYEPTEIERQVAYLRQIDPTGQLAGEFLGKQTYIPPVGGARGPVAYDRFGRPQFVQPDIEHNTQLVPDGRGGFVAAPIPGVAGARADVAGAVTGAQQAQTPHWEDDPFHPGRVHAVYPPGGGPQAAPSAPGAPPAAPPAAVAAPPPAAGTPPARPPPPRTPNTAADLEAQRLGAGSGETYSNQLIKNATSATEVRRSLSELTNLAKAAPPSALNPAKLDLGSYLIAMGANPKWVSQVTGTDVGALVAASKQTGTLALDSIHDMTSRGTNFDLATFMRYNPNLNMGSPEGFQRVVQFIDAKMQQEVAKQNDFNTWKAGQPPNEWASGHTAHWLDVQNKLISSGAATSSVRPPLSSFLKPSGTSP